MAPTRYFNPDELKLPPPLTREEVWGLFTSGQAKSLEQFANIIHHRISVPAEKIISKLDTQLYANAVDVERNESIIEESFKAITRKNHSKHSQQFEFLLY